MELSGWMNCIAMQWMRAVAHDSSIRKTVPVSDSILAQFFKDRLALLN
jgi:hypothetical protein